MTGLTVFLRQRYYPNYTFSRDSSGGCGARSGGTPGDPYKRGRVVDLEIRRWIENRTPVAHPYAKKFIAWVELQRLVPEAAQVHVLRGRVETYIDAVLRDRSGRRFIVEIKTGFHGYHVSSSGRMLNDFSFLSNCPKNQHLLQAAFSEQLYRSTHPLSTVSGSFVLRITDGGVEISYTPAKIRLVATRCLKYF